MFNHIIPLAIATFRNRKGVTAAEYAILAVAIVGAVGTAAGAFAGPLKTMFENLLKATPAGS